MRLSALIAAVGAAATLTFGINATASAETVLRFSHFGPERGYRAETLHIFGKEIADKTGGELQVQFTFGGALLSGKNTLRGVADGVADMGTVVGVYTPAELYNYRVGDLPIGIDDPWAGTTAMYDLFRTNATVMEEFERQNVVPLANFTTTELTLICREPLESLDQLDGLKIRSNPPHSVAFEAFGATAVSMPFPEIYQSLDRGLITCAQSSWGAIEPYRLYEVAKYVTKLNFGQNLAYGVLMSKRRFDSLPASQKQAVIEAGRNLTENFAREAIKANNEAEGRLTSEHGVKVLQLSEEDVARLLKAGSVTIEEFKEKAGPDVLPAFEQLMRKYDAVRKEQGYPWAR